MKMQFHLSEPANHFHVINALSNWDPHCRPNIQAWYQAMFGLSQAEQALLARYAQIRQESLKVGQPESLIPAAFLLSPDLDSAYRQLSHALSEADIQAIRACFDALQEPVALLYRRCLPDLQTRKFELEQRQAEAELEKMLREMRVFFGAPHHLPDLHVYLLLNTCSGCTGGYAPVGFPGHVAVEPRYLGKSHPDYLASDFAIAAHEVSHMIFAANPALKLQIEAELAQVGLEQDKAIYVEEALIVSQFPGGYLPVKYGLIESPKLLTWQDRPLPIQAQEPNLYIYTLQNKLGCAIYPLAQAYLAQAKAVSDGDFLAQAVEKLAEILSQQPG